MARTGGVWGGRMGSDVNFGGWAEPGHEVHRADRPKKWLKGTIESFGIIHDLKRGLGRMYGDMVLLSRLPQKNQFARFNAYVVPRAVHRTSTSGASGDIGDGGEH